ncbi:hypothetical protein [Thiocapsa sp. N5-Cardenillas]|uniref:hypothetical protein n=1 Tax=Thiocapsa sp. N5-Cardenillas TaxID=3137397 RepID=UPI0035B4D3C2
MIEQLHWSKGGEEVNQDEETRREVLAWLMTLDSKPVSDVPLHDAWVDATKEQPVPGCYSYILMEAAKVYRVPGISHFAYTLRFAPLAMVALQGHYASGRQRVDLVMADLGHIAVPVVARIWKEEGGAR